MEMNPLVAADKAQRRSKLVEMFSKEQIAKMSAGSIMYHLKNINQPVHVIKPIRARKRLFGG